MDIQILHMIEGAKRAVGLAVIIDVFRAFTVEPWLISRNAQRIIPVGKIEQALEYKKQLPQVILCGERNGIMVEGFDYGNSPSQFERADLTGKTVIHTTSAGTQGIANAVNADEIITGSFVNALAISKYIKQRNASQVSLVCMGWNATTPTEEDTLCAQYIKSLLEDDPMPDIDEQLQQLRYTSGAKFFDPAQQNVFPQRDFELCIQRDRFDLVLRVAKNGETVYMQRIDI